ncbi:MAG: PDZ domain-containing protein, partial [Phycisphaerae bacterium]|nr:PDZ domain-containing protein [Phycisphaerae bacterium]
KSKILVLANMLPKVTARLERVKVFLPGTAEPVIAKFECTLKDYGGFIATLEKPLGGAVTLSTEDTRKYRNQLLLSARIIIQGQKKTAYFGHNRIISYDLGWKRHMYPEVRGYRDSFMFDIDGTLVAMPVVRREKVSVKERRGSSDLLLTAAPYLAEVLGDLDKNVDKDNVPLTEEEESRLAWMGVELQGLNKELARINSVSDLTNDGQTGALVSYVYPGSPADKAGIQAGFVLLRIHAEDQPKPIDVRVEPYGFGGRAFPWERLDELPEQYYDQIPTPWPGRENLLTRALTDLGFGKKYQAEFFSDGKAVRKDFEVIVSPAHYDTAKRHKSKPLGITVRNLTYELQRYFQKKPEEAGVIISKIEPGSKGSVSGLKPYEIITHVNGKEVADVGEFKKLIADQAELQLLVKRMTRGRTVKIKLPVATTAPTTTTKPAATTQPAGKE